jgi:LysR family transcriptional regulator (chromosome initiation inhibitor)
MLDPAQLAALAAVHRRGSFDLAAADLHVTPSAISQRLKALEETTGTLLIVRGQPCTATPTGLRLIRHHDEIALLETTLAADLPNLTPGPATLRIAVNADSLATWVLPALDPLVQQGLSDGFGLELIVDDQDFTHDWLRQGEVLGCVSTVSQALRGCSCQPLGHMRYVAVASPGFMQRAMPDGLTPLNFPQLPFIVFNRKDDMQAQWVAKAFGVRAPRLKERFVPSSEAGARAAVMGWGVAVLPELLARADIASGALKQLKPEVTIDVALHWHQWKLSLDEPRLAPPAAGARAVTPAHTGLMEQIGQAVIAGARAALGGGAPTR